MTIEDEYLDVLQNIEAAIMGVYRRTPALLDYDVLEAIEALTRHYVLEERHHTFTRSAISRARPAGL